MIKKKEKIPEGDNYLNGAQGRIWTGYKIIKKGYFMEYYVIYDLKDNVIAYIDTLDELASFTSLRKKQLKYEFKNRDFVYYLFNGTYRKIYKFF